MAGFADTDEGREACTLSLMALAEAFGATESAVLNLMPLAMEGRVFLDGTGTKAVFVLAKPVILGNDEKLDKMELREPTAADYRKYAKGLKGDADAADAMNMVIKAAEILAGERWTGVADRMTIRDTQALNEVCGALGFFG